MNRRILHFALLALFLAPCGSAHAYAKKKTLIIALGDSTTAGTPYFKSPLEIYPDGSGDPQGQYSYWMMRRRPEWDVRNFGIAGETSTQIRARFDYAVRLGPRYIIILAGVNDIYQNLPLKSITDNLFWMYEEAKAHSIMPVAATIPPFNRATPEQAEAIAVVNRWIKKESDKLRIPIADLNAATRHPEDPYKLNGSPDGLHPDIGGYRKMGMKLIEAIDPIQKAWR